MSTGGASYLSSADAVLRAGRRLRTDLDTPPTQRNRAIDRLDAAAAANDGEAQTFRAFMFERLGPEVSPERTQRAAAAEDILAGVVTDLQVANVLMAAGQAVGETPATPNPALLDEAIRTLERTVTRAKSTDAAGAGALRFAFIETPATAADATTEQGPAPFAERARETLRAIVKGTESALSDTFSRLANLVPGDVMGALTSLGDVAALPEFGRLVRRGMRKVRAALTALTELIGLPTLAGLRDVVVSIWHRLTDQDPIARVITWALDVSVTEDVVAQVRTDQVDPTSMRDAVGELEQLQVKFNGIVTLARAILTAATAAAAVLSLILTPATVAPFAAGAYAIIIAFVVVSGRDYVDSGSVLRRVRGVGEIAVGLRAGELGREA